MREPAWSWVGGRSIGCASAYNTETDSILIFESANRSVCFFLLAYTQKVDGVIKSF